MRKAILVLSVFIAFITGFKEHALSGSYGDYQRYSADALVINRPVNMQGLTGLLFTNSAYTQPSGSLTFGLSGLAEDSNDPDYTVAQAMGSITVGLGSRVEAAVRGKLFVTSVGSPPEREKDVGDTDLLLKWRFSSQGEVMPALAFGLAWTFPSNSEKGFAEAKYESVRIMLIATGENRILDDGFLGVYLDAQAVFNDELHKDSDSPYKDSYGVLNAGLLFPLSDDNQMQFLVEYTKIFKRDYPMIYDRNYTGFAPGLRYVTDNFSLTLALQKISREEPDPGVDQKANRIAGAINFRF